MKTITIPIDDEILFAVKKDVKHVQADFMQTLAIHYFKERVLGLGLASRMAGMSKNDFVSLLSKHSVDIYQYTDDELIGEFDLVDKINEAKLSNFALDKV